MKEKKSDKDSNKNQKESDSNDKKQSDEKPKDQPSKQEEKQPSSNLVLENQLPSQQPSDIPQLGELNLEILFVDHM